ncbi:unannotated protein [freshwater metagenome]|uniref:Unannotated protein n=1 Tax=freshwater metagenome TaxID=449393 RepID=A0A6J6WLU5_9ZZZZ
MWSKMSISSTTRKGWLMGNCTTIGPNRRRDEFCAMTVSEIGCEGDNENGPLK